MVEFGFDEQEQKDGGPLAISHCGATARMDWTDDVAVFRGVMYRFDLWRFAIQNSVNHI